MKELLFLPHRIPYPPNKGDKIRSFHLLKALAADYRVHLGTFIDRPADWQYRSELERLCGETLFRPLPRRRATLRSLAGLLRGEPLTLGYYRDRRLLRWVRRLLAERPIEAIVVYSSSMAQYALGPEAAGRRRICDFVDLDSDKWRQYAAASAWPVSAVYAREARTLLRLEQRVTECFDACAFVSQDEMETYRSTARTEAVNLHVLENGVDTEYFDPAASLVTPYPAAEEPIVFTGAMDYRANVDAVLWFADTMLPQICQARPQARFYIVGANPARAVRRLTGRANIHVVGAVPDIRPWLRHARLAVAPLRLGRGVQNKVLEALAMDRPVVAFRAAVAGLDPAARNVVTVFDDPSGAVRAVLAVLQADPCAPGLRRTFVSKRYNWAAHRARLRVLLSMKDDRPTVRIQQQRSG